MPYKMDRSVYDLSKVIQDNDYTGVETALRAGADPNQIGPYGNPALHTAIQNSCDCGIISVLLSYGADPDARGSCDMTAMHFAVRSFDPGVFSIILNACKNPDELDQFHRTPLWWAVLCDLFEFAQALLQKGANPNIPHSFFESMLVFSRYMNNAAMFQLLINHGVDIRVPVSDGRLILEVATTMNQPLFVIIIKAEMKRLERLEAEQ
jgi:ankyrin repeat protein